VVLKINEIRTYAHYRDVKPEDWPYKNFTPQEIACRGTGKLIANHAALAKLQALRDLLGRPLIINSAYRSPEYNATLTGAAPNSEHLKGGAFDISMSNQHPIEFEAAAKKVGFTGFGYYPDSNFIHVDIGRPRTWGNRKPFAERAFSPTPDFKAENAAPVNQPTLTQTTLKPETLTALATGVVAPVIVPLVPAVAGNGPFAWAAGFALVAIIVGGIMYFVVRSRNSIRGD